MPDSSAPEKETDVNVASLGLKGVWAFVANFSAVVILVGLYIVQTREISSQAREERAIFREENARQWQLVRENQLQMIKVANTLERNQQEMSRMANSVEKIASKFSDKNDRR